MGTHARSARVGLRAGLLALLLALGCAAPRAVPPAGAGAPQVDPAREQALARDIAALGASDAEARRIAHEALRTSAELRTRYRIVRPALLHNVFVNSGLRERGLCCHFAQDLLARLQAIGVRDLELHWAVARPGSRLREHSAVALQAPGAPFESALVLDAWRQGGALVWARAGADRYPWQLHPLDAERDRLRCSGANP